jgi:hypothetical protein
MWMVRTVRFSGGGAVLRGPDGEGVRDRGATQLTGAVVRRGLKKLEVEYDSRGSAMQVPRPEAGYSLHRRVEFPPFGRLFAPRRCRE